MEISHPGDVDVWTVLDSLISRDGLQSQPGFQVYSHGSSGDIGYDMAWMAFSVDAEDCLQQVWSYLWISDYRGLLFNAFHCSGPGQVHISDLLEIAARSLPYELPYPLPETTAASTASGSTASALPPAPLRLAGRKHLNHDVVGYVHDVPDGLFHIVPFQAAQAGAQRRYGH